jgi:hypothetical protein
VGIEKKFSSIPANLREFLKKSEALVFFKMANLF